MNKKYNKVLLMVLVFFVTINTYAEDQKETYFFRVNVTGIQETVPASLNNYIDYATHNTNANNNNLSLLFKFAGTDASITPVSLLWDKQMGQLSFQFRYVPDRQIQVQRSQYNLFYTKARLHNGDNILKLEISSNLIWVTCNPGTAQEDLIETNATGEGILRINNVALFSKENLELGMGVTMLSNLITTSTPRPRRSTDGESYYDDPVYGEYGYDDVDMMQPIPLGNALDFDGIDDYVAVDPGVYFNGDFTIEAWVKPRSYNTWSRVLDFGNGSGDDVNNIALAIAGGDNFPFLSIGVYSACHSTIQLQLNQWNHIAATLSGTTATLYINGVLAGSATLPVPANVIRNNCYIGKSRVSSDAYANATMDEIRIWNTARTQSQIQDNMNSELTGTEPGLVNYYNFNSGVPCGNNQDISWLPNITNYPNLPPPSDSTIYIDPPGGPVLHLIYGDGTLHNFALGGGESNWVPGVAPRSTDSICIGNPLQLGNYNSGGIWSSRNASVASVDSNGVVKGISAGKAIIDYTYTVNNSCPAISSTEITVNAPSLVATNTGNALNFNGINNYVWVEGGYPATSEITYEMWFNSNSFYDPGFRKMLINHQTTDTFYSNVSLYFFSGKLELLIDDNITDGIWEQFNQEFNTNTWYHVAIVYSATTGTLKFYVNGHLDKSMTSVNSVRIPGSIPYTIGSYFYPTNQGNFFDGKIDELRIWNTIRTQTQIQANINSELSATDTIGLVAYYNFNQGIANGTNTGITTVIDKSPNQNNGTVHGFALTGNASNWVSGIVQDSSANLCAGSILQLNNAVTGGLWTSANPTIASVSAVTGVVTGLAAGTATINYTMYSDNSCPVISSTKVTVGGAIVLQNTGNALGFDGIDDYVNIPNSSSLQFTNGYTLEAMIKPAANDKRILDKVTAGYSDGPFTFDTHDGLRLIVGLSPNEYILSTNVDIPLNVWTHVAATCDVSNGVVKLYVNGTLSASGTFTGVLRNSSFPVRIGAPANGSTNGIMYKGLIDEVRIWKQVRSEQQIQANYFGELADNDTTGLLAYYKFNQGIAGGTNAGITSLIDKSLNGNNGTLNGFALSGAASNWVAGVVPDNAISLNTCSVSQLNNTVAGGIWSSTNTAVATVDSTGLVSAIGAGTASIQYKYIIPMYSCPVISATAVTVSIPTIAKNTGNALSFDGVNDYVSRSTATGLNFNTTNAMTAEAWIKFVPNNYRFWLSLGGTNYRFGIDPNGYPFWDMGQHVDRYLSSFTFNANTWYHVAFTASKDAATNHIFTRLYINGELKATQDEGITSLPAVSQLYVGCGELSTLYNFNGNIDELRIWNTARSQAQIQANMNGEMMGTEPGLVTYYNFNQGIAGGTNTGITSLIDQSPNANNGTLNNFTLSGTASNWVAGNAAKNAVSLNRCNSSQLNNPVTAGIWSSTDTTIASVSSTGVVTGIAAGTATINYTYNTSGSCAVNSATSVTISSSAITKNKGNGLSFDGVNDYVAVKPGTYFNGNFTVEAWVYPKSYNTWSRVLDFGNGSDANNIALAIAGGNNFPFLSIGVSYACYSSIQLQLNQWNHIAATLNGTTATIYINGVFAGSATLPVATNVLLNNCYLGRSRVSSDAYANAVMDEVRIWNIARTQTQIQQSMNSGLSGTEPGLLAYYNFSQGIAGGTNTGTDSLIDRTLNANNGTLNNFALSGTSSNWVAGNVSSSTIMLYPGANFQLNNATIGGVWSSDNSGAVTVSSTGVVTAVTNGFATVTYAVPISGNCYATTSTDVIVGTSPAARSSITAIPSIHISENSAIRIYPNPAHNHVTILLVPGMESAAIAITNVLGTRIATDNNQGLQRNFNLVGISSGIYFVTVTQKDGTKSNLKLVIN